MNIVHPRLALRRSLLSDVHSARGAQFRWWQNQIIVSKYTANNSGSCDDVSQLGRLALCDLSTLDRCGFKGAGTPQWLNEQAVELELPAKPNRATTEDQSVIIARLSIEEHLILSQPFTERKDRNVFSQVSLNERRVYSLPRQDSHAWLYLCGESAALMMSFVCAIDLCTSKFIPGAVAQTSVAKVNALIIRHDIGGIPGFHLLCDQPSVNYWWDALLDAAIPLGGKPIGIDALIEHYASSSLAAN